MESRPPEDIHRVQTFYNDIAPYLESQTGMEARQSISDWNTDLLNDLHKEAETLMLMYGQGVSDRFLYGFFTGYIGMRHENGDSLPELSPELYGAIHDAQDLMVAEQDEQAVAYLNGLEDKFYEKFPITATLIAHLEIDLKMRLGVPEIDIEEGFVSGWFKAIKVVMPLFRD